MQLLLKNLEILRKVKLIQSLRTSRLSGLESLLGNSPKILPGIQSDGNAYIKKIYIPAGKRPRVPGMIPVDQQENIMLQEQPYIEWVADTRTIQGNECQQRIQALAFMPLIDTILLEAGIPARLLYQLTLDDYTLKVDCPPQWANFPEKETYLLDIQEPQILDKLPLANFIQPWQLNAPEGAQCLEQLIIEEPKWFTHQNPMVEMLAPNVWASMDISGEGKNRTASLRCGWEPRYIDPAFSVVLKEWFTTTMGWMLIEETETNFEVVI